MRVHTPPYHHFRKKDKKSKADARIPCNAFRRSESFRLIAWLLIEYFY